MTRGWEPGVQYNYGDSVEYHGHQYNIIQAHRSQGDWTPDVTPALWGLVPYHDCDDEHKEKHHGKAHDHERQQRPPSDWNPQQERGQQPVNIPYQTEKIQPEERHLPWQNLSDERKKQLEIGGGIAVGIGLLGAGFAAYKHHQKSEEEQKSYAWGLQNWVHEAQQRAQRFRREGPTGPFTWVLVQGKDFPENALVGGQTDDEVFYVARTFHEGGIQLGKASVNSNKGCVIGYEHDTVDYDTYEILIGDVNAARWVDVRGQLSIDRLDIRPIEGGREANGEKQWIIQTEYRGGVHVGKVAESYKHGGYIAYDGKEVEVENYRVLAYA